MIQSVPQASLGSCCSPEKVGNAASLNSTGKPLTCPQRSPLPSSCRAVSLAPPEPPHRPAVGAAAQGGVARRVALRDGAHGLFLGNGHSQAVSYNMYENNNVFPNQN